MVFFLPTRTFISQWENKFHRLCFNVDVFHIIFTIVTTATWNVNLKFQNLGGYIFKKSDKEG